MKIINLLTIVVMLTSAGLARSQGKHETIDLPKKFAELLPGMGAKDIGARHGPQQQWQTICYKAGAPGNEKMRLAVCELMIAKLGPDTPSPARLWLLKQLEFLGRAECVESVAAAMDDKDALVHDAAVRCLANNPAKEATAKLLARLPDSTGKSRIGLINALAFRRDPAAVPALTEELKQADKMIGSAAARALGKIGTADAARALETALKDAAGDTRLWIADAYLLCADRRLKEGKPAEASVIYKQIYEKEKEPSIRLAALQGVLKTSGDNAGNLILEIIGGKDAGARAIAIGQIEAISPAALNPLAANMDKLPPAGQVLVLGALASRGDRKQLPVALTAIKSPDAAIQRAGMLALGRLGDAGVVPLLVAALFGNPKLSDAARESLVNVTGDGVDAKILTALKAEKKLGNRGILIAILETRRATVAVPVLLEDARGSDAGTRKTAMSALRQLAEPAHIPALIHCLLKTDKGAEREDAERTIVAVCEKLTEAEQRTTAILNVYQKADPAEKLALLPLLGRVGGRASLPIIKEALASKDAGLREAAVQGLCNWPEPSVSDDLLNLVESAKEPAQRARALRSVIRVNSVPSEQANTVKLETLKKVMKLAMNDDEKRLVLDGLATVKDIGTLRFVVPYLDNKNLAQSACRTIVELAHSRTLREPNQAEFVKALNRVIVICRDKGLIDRAKQYRQGD